MLQSKPMATNAPPPGDPPEHEAREDEYEELSRRVAMEELHDQIALRGLEVLGRGVPYVVQAARWRRIDAARRRSRESVLEVEPVDVGRIMGPFEAAVANEQRRMLADALAALPVTDALAVWRHVEGVPDEEIAAAIERLGQGRITPAAIRMRRMRALDKLRHVLKSR
jgi:hypothetical protein